MWGPLRFSMDQIFEEWVKPVRRADTEGGTKAWELSRRDSREAYLLEYKYRKEHIARSLLRGVSLCYNPCIGF